MLCVEPNCTKHAKGKTDRCIGHGGGIRCIVADCTKSAQGNTNRCIGHGGGRRCTEPDCTKSAQRNTDRCVEHGGGVRCNEPECTKSSIGKNGKCVEHGGGQRCSESGCTKTARSKKGMCIEHGGGVRCNEPECTKSAQGKTNRCVEHGGGVRCNEPECNKSAIGKTKKCIGHGGGRRCTESGCTKGAEGKIDRCKAHGGGRRCPNCITWPDSRSAKSKYDGYCATCFKQIFPTDERSKVVYTHTKEMRVRNEINKHFDGFIHDIPLYTGNCDCTHRRRIDHRKLIGATLLCVETDELGHAGYDSKDEEIRYDDLYMVHSGKWIFIRFNPDGKGVDMVDKLDSLVKEIKIQTIRIESEENIELLEIVKLFY